jgi:hypothetical protein
MFAFVMCIGSTCPLLPSSAMVCGSVRDQPAVAHFLTVCDLRASLSLVLAVAVVVLTMEWPRYSAALSEMYNNFPFCVIIIRNPLSPYNRHQRRTGKNWR